MSRRHGAIAGRQWTQARRVALECSGWRCSRCGAAGRLEVHHRTPLHLGGAPYAAENLEVMCRSCHIDAHRPVLTDAEQAWRDLVDAIR